MGAIKEQEAGGDDGLRRHLDMESTRPSSSFPGRRPGTILLIGKNGQVGWELGRTLAPLGRLVCVDYPEIDLTEGDSIRKWIQDTRPDVIVNAAAYTAVDKAEKESDLAMKINGTAPGILAELAKSRGAWLVHYSTDYVFDGTKKEPYTELDKPDPISVYGRSKWAGDQAVQAVDGHYLIFRLCWVYGTRGHNFALTIMRLARERERLRVVADQFGGPTWSRMIAETTGLALQSVALTDSADTQKGVYHLAAAGVTSWHGFAESIVRRMPETGRMCREVDAITTPEYPLPARRPAYSVLDSAKLRRVFGLGLPEWEESLGRVMEEARFG
jgi:dTDP-4-dehydrorhamnose reductase